ncbi:MAG: leucyl/phenylalanyl-tRNA--protein transferase [Pseudomonadota bacterium]
MARDSADRLQAADIMNAYRLGYFPMSRSRFDPSIVWVLPDERGVLELDHATAPKKLRRLLKREPFQIKFNENFHRVLLECAAPAKGREDTWINDQILEAYCELHALGWAHSVECYAGDELVGGLYGVEMGAIFCGESMFSRRTNASKIAMLYLIAALKEARFAILDTQFFTEHLSQFGVEEWPDAAYQSALQQYADDDARFPRKGYSLSSGIVSQLITQTS